MTQTGSRNVCSNEDAPSSHCVGGDIPLLELHSAAPDEEKSSSCLHAEANTPFLGPCNAGSDAAWPYYESELEGLHEALLPSRGARPSVAAAGGRTLAARECYSSPPW